MKCNLCPRNCNADRASGNTGVCGVSDKIYIARAGIHMWEEPCISGKTGSGTVFFSGCSLKCVYCQNYNVSRANIAKEVSVEKLSDIFMSLESEGALNINLVTGDHYVPWIIKSIELAKTKGIKIPFVFNTSSYLNENTLNMLDGLIDIYLADLKYLSSGLAKKYSNAENYPEAAKKAIDIMVNQIKGYKFENDVMKRGVIVRHLVLPGNVLEAKKVLKYLFNTYGDDIYISIMSQYTPFGKLDGFSELNRKITEAEYERVVDYSIKSGIKNAYIQDGTSADESFIPDFNCNI